MPTLHDAVSIYLLINRSPQTNRSYRNTLTRLEDFLGPATDLTAITTPDLLRFFQSIRSGLKPSSEATYTISAKTFFTWCADTMNYLPFSPAARIKLYIPDPPPPEASTMPVSVLQASYAKAAEKRPRFAIRDRAILAFIDDTACRRKAVALLKLSQLNLEKWEAYPEEKGRQQKPLLFSRHAADALAAWLAIRPRCKHDYVFTHLFRGSGYIPLKPEAVSSIIRRLTEGAGARTYGPHSLRKLVVQDMNEHGESDVICSNKLNHKNMKTTLQHYLSRSKHTARAATDRREARRHPPVSPGGNIILLDFDDDLASVE